MNKALTSEDLASHIRFTSEDVDEEAPVVNLMLLVPTQRTLCLDKQTKVDFNLYTPGPGTEGFPKPSVELTWDCSRLFLDSVLVLFHHRSSGIEAIDISPQEGPPSGNYTWSVFPGANGNTMFSLRVRENYLRVIEPGETYTLLFPGIAVQSWERKNEQADEGRAPGLTLSKPKPPVIIPGGSYITFQPVVEGRRTGIIPPPYTAGDRIVSAPVLSMTKTCKSSLLKRGENTDFYVTVRYEAPATARPIVFHKQSLWMNSKYYKDTVVYRKEGMDWCYTKPAESPPCGFFLWEDWPSLKKITDDNGFYSLEPGEVYYHRSWNDWDYLFPEDTRTGDKFQIRYLGAEIEWWDWGTMEDHAERALWCMNGHVVEENGFRSRLIVPGCSVEVEVGD